MDLLFMEYKEYIYRRLNLFNTINKNTYIHMLVKVQMYINQHQPIYILVVFITCMTNTCIPQHCVYLFMSFYRNIIGISFLSLWHTQRFANPLIVHVNVNHCSSPIMRPGCFTWDWTTVLEEESSTEPPTSLKSWKHHIFKLKCINVVKRLKGWINDLKQCNSVCLRQ